MKQNQSFVTPVLAKWLVKLLKQTAEVDHDELMRLLNLQVTAAGDFFDRLTLPNYLVLLNWAAIRTGNDDFGLSLASKAPIDVLSSVGIVMSHATTLREHFQSLHRFGILSSKAISFTFVEGPVSSRLEYRLLHPDGVNSRHDSEYTLAILVRFCRHYFSNNFVPSRVHFTHSEPSQVTRPLPIFGQAVCFEQSANAICFPTSILDTGIGDVNTTLLASLRAEVSKHLVESKLQNTLISQVRFFIAATLSSSACVSENAAVALLLSQRSLTRHLQHLGTSFRGLKQDVMMVMAKRALAESNASMGEISLHLGFSETSAFDRSFKKMTGYTPLQYRGLEQR